MVVYGKQKESQEMILFAFCFYSMLSRRIEKCIQKVTHKMKRLSGEKGGPSKTVES